MGLATTLEQSQNADEIAVTVLFFQAFLQPPHPPPAASTPKRAAQDVCVTRATRCHEMREPGGACEGTVVAWLVPQSSTVHTRTTYYLEMLSRICIDYDSFKAINS